MKKFLTVFVLLLALVAALAVIPLLAPKGEADPEADAALPWQIETLYGGKSRVFRVILGESTLADARQILGSDVQVALIAAPGEAGAVEAFYDSFKAGFVTGKLIATVDLSDTALEAMKQRALRSEYMESSTRRYILTPADLETANQTPLRALSFIPSINLDAGMVEQRFGAPVERIVQGKLEHLLYPAKGLDVVLDKDGKEVLQYVAPGRFAQLRDPLLLAPQSR